jgi:hypothetical protein
MHCFVSSSLMPILALAVGRRLAWVEKTFMSRAAAEEALNGEYITFTNRKDIMERIPPRIRGFIKGGPEARVTGLQELFAHLDGEVGRNALRILVVDFFANSQLAEHLSQSLPFIDP